MILISFLLLFFYLHDDINREELCNKLVFVWLSEITSYLQNFKWLYIIWCNLWIFAHLFHLFRPEILFHLILLLFNVNRFHGAILFTFLPLCIYVWVCLRCNIVQILKTLIRETRISFWSFCRKMNWVRKCKLVTVSRIIDFLFIRVFTFLSYHFQHTIILLSGFGYAGYFQWYSCLTF